MFVNSCLFKTEKCVLYESLHFVSCLQYVFFIFIFFSFRVKLYIAIDTLAVVCSVQYCQKPLLPHVLKKLGFIFLLFFFLSFFHHSTGNEKKVRQCPGLKLQKKKQNILWNGFVETIRRQHLALNMKTEFIHCLWVTYTTPLWANTGASKGWFFNRSLEPDRGEQWRGREQGREGRGGHVGECNWTKQYNKSQLLSGHYPPEVLCSRLFLPLHCHLFLSRLSARSQEGPERASLWEEFCDYCSKPQYYFNVHV